jgi:mercuric ion transport protein
MGTDTHLAESRQRPPGGMTRPVFAAGGLLAAFGVASCCALPFALSALGISAASLVGFGFIVAPFQRELLLAAVLCLATVAVLSWRGRRVRTGIACASERSTALRAVGLLTFGSVIAAVGLIALTFWIESPL